ncbi:GNAT family N-acetyltransferase, partial [Rhizobium ruizarguesonis]
WQVRLTAGHPSNRLNSIVPLDPSDHRDVEIRLEKARRKFEAYGRAAVVRQTPLASPVLIELLRAQNWTRFDDTVVMTCDLAEAELPDT